MNKDPDKENCKQLPKKSLEERVQYLESFVLYLLNQMKQASQNLPIFNPSFNKGLNSINFRLIIDNFKKNLITP